MDEDILVGDEESEERDRNQATLDIFRIYVFDELIKIF